MVIRIICSICVGIASALLSWCAGMFIYGGYYWFMQVGEYGHDAGPTRIVMLMVGAFAAFAYFTYPRDK